MGRFRLPIIGFFFNPQKFVFFVYVETVFNFPFLSLRAIQEEAEVDFKDVEVCLSYPYYGIYAE